MKKLVISASALAFSLVAATGLQAQTVQQKKEEAGAVGGAISGGTAGAVGGALVGGPVGAAVGGVAGATAGAITGGAAASLSPEDRVYVRERVVTRQVPSVTYEGDVVVGRELPGTVRYYDIEGNPRLSNYRYTRVNDRYVIVDRSNRIIEVVE
jgi:uncharacterized protein YcfJ